MTKRTLKSLLVSSFVFVSACGNQTDFNRYVTASAANSTGNDKFVPAFCSGLNFSGVTWSTTLTTPDRTALALSLDISGSFEGANAWSNITDNFDGQGLSLGLLNQNLGQESLQPLLIEMDQKHHSVMQKIFSVAHLASLEGMLQKYKPFKIKSVEPEVLSPLDISDKEMYAEVAAANDSVQWAIDNLYVNGRFSAQWKKELMAMSTSWEFISIQIKAAENIHRKVLDYMETFDLHQLRSYIMLFDVVVQNGGLYSADIQDFASYLKSAAPPSETLSLTKILELRLRHVRAQYLSDVRSRKNAIIQGYGVVHGSMRHLESEYCFNRLVTYR